VFLFFPFLNFHLSAHDRDEVKFKESLFLNRDSLREVFCEVMKDIYKCFSFFSWQSVFFFILLKSARMILSEEIKL